MFKNILMKDRMEMFNFFVSTINIHLFIHSINWFIYRFTFQKCIKKTSLYYTYKAPVTTYLQIFYIQNLYY